MFTALIVASQIIVAQANDMVRNELPAAQPGHMWQRVERESYLCSIGYYEGNFADFSVMSTRIGLTLDMRFREGHPWFQGEDWLDPNNRIFLRQLVFERGADDDKDYPSTFGVDTGSTQSKLEQGYTAMISSPSAMRGMRRDFSFKRMTVYESAFLRRMATNTHLTVIAEDAKGEPWTYRLEIPRDIGPQIAWQRECADRFP